MVNTRLKRILILFSVAMNLGILAFALYHYAAEESHGKGRRGDRHQRFYERLDLSPQQINEIDVLVKEYIERKRKLGRESRRLDRKFYALLLDKHTDTEKLDSILDRMASLKRRREELTFHHLAKVRALLTDEQAEKMFSMLLKHAGEKRGDGHGRPDEAAGSGR